MENSELKVIDKIQQGGLKMERFENLEGRQFLSVNGCEPVELNTERISLLYGFMQDIFFDYMSEKVKIDDMDLNPLAGDTHAVTNSELKNIVKQEAEKMVKELGLK